MKTVAVFLMSLLFLARSNAQETKQSGTEPKIVHDIPAMLHSRIRILYLKVVDGIVMDSPFQIPAMLTIKNDFKIDFDSTVKSLEMRNLAETPERPAALRIINTCITKQHEAIYLRTATLPAYSKYINLPVVINNKLYLPDDYPALTKIDINKYNTFQYIEGKIAMKKYSPLLLFGVISVTY